MPRLTRRSFAALITALAVAPVMAQNATPETGDSIAEDRMRYILFDVIEGGEYTGLPDVVTDGIDINAMIEGMTEAHQFANNGVLSLNMLCSDGDQAMAYATITSDSGSEYSLFGYLAVDDAGLIRSYRWVAQYDD